ncbi:MAG: hypothetical protein GY841_22490 [FCB group bacterium]|nr:hypothetical protein [FCB group bacterium]
MLVPVALLLCFATALIPCHAEEPPYLRTYEDFIEYKTVGPFETTYDGDDWNRWEAQWSTDIINNPEYRSAFSELLDGAISDWYERPVTAPGLSKPEPAPVDTDVQVDTVVECDTTILITNSDFPGIKIWWTPPCDTTYVPVEP